MSQIIFGTVHFKFDLNCGCYFCVRVYIVNFSFSELYNIYFNIKLNYHPAIKTIWEKLMEGSYRAGGHRTIKPTVNFLMPSKPKFICHWKSCNSSEKLFSRLLILNRANHEKEKKNILHSPAALHTGLHFRQLSKLFSLHR